MTGYARRKYYFFDADFCPPMSGIACRAVSVFRKKVGCNSGGSRVFDEVNRSRGPRQGDQALSMARGSGAQNRDVRGYPTTESGI